MLTYSLFQTDAFIREGVAGFTGNPAAVVPLQSWLPDPVMQAIAAENNLSETAFFIRNKDGIYDIRWFTPVNEVDLCGHATLACAQVIVQELGDQRSRLPFRCGIGELAVDVDQTGGTLWLDFPVRHAVPADDTALQQALAEALNTDIRGVYAARDLLVELADEDSVLNCRPDFSKLAQLDTFAVTITAKAVSPGYDFVSRFFAPQQGLNEDPVTGSSFCSLTPFWAGRLHRNELRAWQCSARGGDIRQRLDGDRVKIGGKAFTYLRGQIRLPAGYI